MPARVLHAAGATAFLAAVLACAVLSVASARANGVPQLVRLDYVEGISNWGPRDAEGVLEFSFAEAYARSDVKGLVPPAGVTFEGWLLAPDGASFKVGTYTMQPSGIGSMDAEMGKMERYDYDTFVIAARSAGTPEGIPAQRAIAGVFQVVGSEGTSSAHGDVRPGVLPDTGQPEPMSKIERAGWTLVVMACVAAIVAGGAWFLRRKRGVA